MPGRPTVSIRFSAAQIAGRVDEMAAELAAKLPADTLVVSVLKGSFVFAADLIRALSRAGADWSMDFLTLSSYGSGTETTGRVRVVRDIVDDVRGREVLLVDDILESGFTLSFAKNLLQERGARHVSICTLLDKPASGAPSSRPISSASRPATNFSWATASTGRTAFAGCPISGWWRRRPRSGRPEQGRGAGSGLLPAAGEVSFLAVQLRLEVLDALIGQTRKAYGDDHRVDGAADGSHGLELTLLVAEVQP